MNNVSGVEVVNTSYRPLIFDLSQSDDWHALEQLRLKRQVWRTVDRLPQQLNQWIDARHVGKSQGQANRQQAITDILGDCDLEQFGRWVYYPWSGQLVHILPEPMFNQLRLDRNRNKITKVEQVKLSQLAIGIIGLSAGNAIALTLALEGIGETFKLADFDQLELANMNRLRASLHDLGVSKTVLTARQIYEVNPYAQITLFEAGITMGNIEAFLLESPRLDLIIEECDSMNIKFMVREKACQYRIPVIMETGDRGMLDVERFDLEPGRPIFHGRVCSTAGEASPELSPARRIELGLQIVGAADISAELAASMTEIGHTISTWPQLASEVALGGALVATAVHGMFCDQTLSSGRYYADLRQILQIAPPHVDKADSPAPVTCHLSQKERHYIAEHAALAPSGGNVQPWQFEFKGQTMKIRLDQKRAKSLLNAGGRAAYLALGAATENAMIAANSLGYLTVVSFLPERDLPLTGAIQIEFQQGDCDINTAQAQLTLVRQRVTNRRLSVREPLAAEDESQLKAVLADDLAQLQLVKDDVSIQKVADIIGKAERIRLLNAHLHPETIAEVRWTSEETQRTRDGIDIETLEPTTGDRAALEILKRSDVAVLLRRWRAGEAISAWSAKPVECASAVGLLIVKTDDAVGYMQAGVALQRLWLKATELKLAMQPMTALLYMLQMLDSSAYGNVFESDESEQLRQLESQLTELYGPHPRGRRALLFRLAKAAAPTVRSLRLPLNAVMKSDAI